MRILLLISILSSQLAFSQSRKIEYEKIFKKADQDYQVGNYKSALKRIKSIEKKFLKKHPTDSVYKSWASIQKAKTFEAMGKFSDMESELSRANNALSKVEAIPPGANEDYLKALCQLAEVYIFYGNFLKADQAIQSARLASQIPSALSQFWINYQRAFIHAGAGNFAEGHAIIDSLIKQYPTLLGTARLSGNQKRLLKTQYAQLHTLKGQLFTKSGFYEKADSVFDATKARVRKAAGITSLPYILHLIAIAENYDAQQQYRQASQYYKMSQRAEEYYDNSFGKSSKVYFRLQEGIARNSILRGQLRIVQNLEINELKKEAKKYFGKESVYTLRAQMLEVERFLDRKNYEEAQQTLEDILKNEKLLPADHTLRATAMELLGQLYAKKDDINFALMDSINRTSYQIQQKRLPSESFELKISSLKYANYLNEYTDNFKNAKEIFNETPYSLVSSTLSASHKDFTQLSTYYAQFYRANDEYTQAFKVTQTANELLEKKYGLSDLRLLNIKNLLAKIQADLGNYREAEKNANAGLKLLQDEYGRSATQNPLYAYNLVQVASVYSSIGEYNKADSLLRASEQVYRNIAALSPEERLKRDIEVNLNALRNEMVEESASLYIRIGDYLTTEKILTEILEKREKKYGFQSRKLIYPLNQLASLYLLQGDYPKAEKFIGRSYKISDEVYGKSSLFFSSAKLLQSKWRTGIGDYDKAETDAQEALKIEEQKLGANHIKNADLITNLALIQLVSNPKENAKKSEENLLRAKDIVQKTFDNNHPQYAEALKDIAAVYIEIGKPAQAITLLDEAVKIWTKKLGEKNINLAKAFSLKADAYTKIKDFNQAESYYLQSNTIYKEAFGETYEGYVKNTSRLGRLYYINQNYSKAIENLDASTANYIQYISKNFPFLSEREKAKYWASIQSDFEFYKSLAIKVYTTQPEVMAKVYNHILATKALLLNSSQKVRSKILNSGDQKLIDNYNLWTSKKEYLTIVLAMSADERKTNNIDPAIIEQEIEALEKQMTSSSDLVAQALSIKNYTWMDIKTTLQPDEAAIEITKFRFFDKNFTDSTIYLALKVTPNTTQYPEVVIMPEGNSMDNDMLNYYRNTIRFKRKNARAYPTYWQPIEKLLASTKKVYISADGAYNQLNLETIITPAGNYVIDDYNIYLVSNTKDLLTPKTEVQSSTKRALLCGNPKFYMTERDAYKIADLPGTASEIEAIQEIMRQGQYQTQILTGDQADEDRIKEVMNNPTIIHFATHGFFAPTNSDLSESFQEAALSQNPLLRSGLLLRNAGEILEDSKASVNAESGIYTAIEAMNANLDNTDLVSLSACETSLGEVQVGEGVFGLQRAFLVAGANALIMSLFKVDDQTTVELMTAFYKFYILQKQPKREALRNAKLQVKENHPDPIDWGAFVMIGG